MLAAKADGADPLEWSSESVNGFINDVAPRVFSA